MCDPLTQFCTWVTSVWAGPASLMSHYGRSRQYVLKYAGGVKLFQTQILDSGVVVDELFFSYILRR